MRSSASPSMKRPVRLGARSRGVARNVVLGEIVLAGRIRVPSRGPVSGARRPGERVGRRVARRRALTGTIHDDEEPASLRTRRPAAVVVCWSRGRARRRDRSGEGGLRRCVVLLDHRIDLCFATTWEVGRIKVRDDSKKPSPAAKGRFGMVMGRRQQTVIVVEALGTPAT
jgi:hypothetical protein